MNERNSGHWWWIATLAILLALSMWVNHQQSEAIRDMYRRIAQPEQGR